MSGTLRHAARIASAGVAALLVARAAHAEESVAVSLDYSAPKECASDAELWAGVERYTKRAHRADAGAGQRIRVTVTHRDGADGADGEWAATYERTSADDAYTARRLRGASCREIADAVELVIAIAIDPSVRPPDPPPEPPPETPPAPAGATSPVASNAAPAQLPGAQAPRPDSGASRPAPADVRPALSGRRATSWSYAFGAHGAVTGLLAKELITSVGAHFDAGRLAERGLVPAGRVSIDRSAPLRVAGANESASFTWTTLGVGLCPLRAGLVTDLRVVGCATAQGGTVEATDASGGVELTDATRPWLATGLEARVEWRVVGAIAIEVGAGAQVSLLRERFLIVPEAEIYRPGPFLALGSVGASAGF